jgi:K+ transporter
LVAAAALMADYLTAVAVSVTAGVEALIALAPGLDPHRVTLDVAAIVILMVINLRGVREAGALFVLPTYMFTASLAALLGGACSRWLPGTLETCIPTWRPPRRGCARCVAPGKNTATRSR